MLNKLRLRFRLWWLSMQSVDFELSQARCSLTNLGSFYTYLKQGNDFLLMTSSRFCHIKGDVTKMKLALLDYADGCGSIARNGTLVTVRCQGISGWVAMAVTDAKVDPFDLSQFHTLESAERGSK